MTNVNKEEMHVMVVKPSYFTPIIRYFIMMLPNPIPVHVYFDPRKAQKEFDFKVKVDFNEEFVRNIDSYHKKVSTKID